jgi:hypothetical protein
MKKKQVSVTASIFIFLMIVCFGKVGSVSAGETGIVKLNFKIIESGIDEKQIVTVVKLKAKNNSRTALSNLNVRLLETENMSIDIDAIYIGDVESGQTIISSELITITADNSPSQEEPTTTKSVWQVEFRNSKDEYITEEIIL